MFSLYLKVHDDFFEDELKRLFPAEQRSRVTYLADMLMMVCYLSPSDASSIASAFEWGGGRKLVGTWEQAIAEHACEGMENAGLDVFLVPAYLHRDEALEAIKEDGNELQHASLELRADRNVVLAAVRQAGGLAIAYASPGLQADREIVLEAVRQNGDALRYASAELWADREGVLEAVRQNGDHDALRYASTELRADICEVLLEGGRENKGQALLFASRELWADRGFFQEAVRQNGNALRYATDADPELEADRELVLEAVRQNGNAIRHGCLKRAVGGSRGCAGGGAAEWQYAPVCHRGRLQAEEGPGGGASGSGGAGVLGGGARAKWSGCAQLDARIQQRTQGGSGGGAGGGSGAPSCDFGRLRRATEGSRSFQGSTCDADGEW
eukprot:scaffold120554_cov30-Phaeocystis_antarctica.AAC.1